MVVNVHERHLHAPPAHVGRLLDTLAGPHDRLWPVASWPPLRLDRPLAVGATGGHGPIRYTVDTYLPGTAACFRFAPSLGDGGHCLLVLPGDGGGTVLRHELKAELCGRMRLAWPVAVRWLHDALIEDLLDRAEAAVDGAVARPARWSPWVRLLRTAEQQRRRASRRRTRSVLPAARRHSA